MSLRPMYKKCEYCGNIYNFYPEGGRFNCPVCHGTGLLTGKSGKKKKNTILDKVTDAIVFILNTRG